MEEVNSPQVHSVKSVKIQCLDTLLKAGAPPEVCNFYADVLQCEYDLTHTTYQLQTDLKASGNVDAALLFSIIQKMTKNFYNWKLSVMRLRERGASVPPLKLSPNLSPSKPLSGNGRQQLTALCTLETKQMSLCEGEPLFITDTAHPNQIKVRNSRGEEGYVPTLCCLLPSPDTSATNAVERLCVHLLTSWTECSRKLKAIFYENLKPIISSLRAQWEREQRRVSERDRINRRFRRVVAASHAADNGLDLNRLHTVLFSLEKELSTLNMNELAALIEGVCNLDKAVLCYENFDKQWKEYRSELLSAAKPIRLVQSFNQLRQVAHGQNFKYFEVKMMLDDVQTREEIIYVNSDKLANSKESYRLGSGSKLEEVKTEQLTSSMIEEKKRFYIRSVVDPRTGAEISMKEAIDEGIIDPQAGLYVNPHTDESRPIQEAMNEQLIRVDHVSTSRSAEQRKEVGLVTIRTRVDVAKDWTLTGAFDAVTGERVSLEEAQERGIIVYEEHSSSGGAGSPILSGFYVNISSGERLALPDAVQQGWAFADYHDDEGQNGAEYDEHTYAISEVRDERLKCNVPFSEAVRRGLLDRDTGFYVNNVTRNKVYIVEALNQGLIQGRLVEDPTGLNISTANTVVIERINRIKKNVLKGLNVISAFKAAVAERKE